MKLRRKITNRQGQDEEENLLIKQNNKMEKEDVKKEAKV